MIERKKGRLRAKTSLTGSQRQQRYRETKKALFDRHQS